MKDFKFWLVKQISFIICWLFHKTYRYRVVHGDRHQKALDLGQDRGFVIASWHNNCFAGIMSHHGQKICLLVSPSKDGEMIAKVARGLGMDAKRGSSSRGGKEALDELVDTVKSGWSSAITVDGPRGPFKKVKAGIVSLASKAQAPILPVCAIGDRQWVFHKSWDKFRLPKPFAKVHVIYGAPIKVPEELSGEQFQDYLRQVKDSLEGLEAEAQSILTKA